MRHALELFLKVARAYTDLTFGRSRDELISRCIKALRALKEQSLDTVKANKDIGAGIGDLLEEFERLTREYPEDAERLIGLLTVFLKSPIPCKIRLINFSEVLVEDRGHLKKGV